MTLYERMSVSYLALFPEAIAQTVRVMDNLLLKYFAREWRIVGKKVSDSVTEGQFRVDRHSGAMGAPFRSEPTAANHTAAGEQEPIASAHSDGPP